MEQRLSALWGRTPTKAEGQKESISVAEWSPLVDITEDDKEYLIKAELPEIKKEDVKLTVQDNVLAISGERKYEKEEKDKKYHRMERAYGSFSPPPPPPPPAPASQPAPAKSSTATAHKPEKQHDARSELSGIFHAPPGHGP